MRADIQKHLRFNFITHTMEASFFGLALGFASYVTVIPLFVASLTDSSVLIGVIAAMRTIGLQLPQIFTANRVAGLRRYKPMVLFMTVQERLPFFGMALVALLTPRVETGTALALMFLFVTWQAMGGGLTGTAWQSMVAKIIPPRLRGTFYGVLMSASNLMSSGGAIVAGLILSAGSAPANFGLCFFLAGISVVISFGFLSQIREPEAAPASETTRSSREFWRGLREILRRDGNFRLFIGARLLAQVASVGTAFFTVYAVRHFALDAGTAGVMTGVLLLAQVLTNPVFGWLGDRYSHRVMFAVGALLAGGSAAVALFAPSLEWFYVVFALAGIANAGLTPTIYALIAEFGSEAERPSYIGLANTLVAPATLLAPIIGGWLADAVSYQAMFGAAAVTSIVTVAVIFLIREPRRHYAGALAAAPPVEMP